MLRTVEMITAARQAFRICQDGLEWYQRLGFEGGSCCRHDRVIGVGHWVSGRLEYGDSARGRPI